MDLIKKDFIFSDVKKLKGVGFQLSKYLKRKKIEKIKDILLNLPYSETDRSKISEISSLEIGKIQTIQVLVKKLNFPRKRNLPNKINCEDETGKIEIVYFNSREGYLRKIFPVNEWVVISGKVNYFRNKYQITNPDYVASILNKDYVLKNIPKYSLTDGLNEKKYRSISEQVIAKLPDIEDWLEHDFIYKNNLLKWNEAIKRLHNSNDSKNITSKSYRRLVFDEILANFLSLSENRRRIRKKKIKKYFKYSISNTIINELPFQLTTSQNKVYSEINKDLLGGKRMFRILQGDVGPITKNDVQMAKTSGADVIGFNVKLDNGVMGEAKHQGIRVFQNNIIYEIIDLIKDNMADLLEPEVVEKKTGRAEVRQVFKLSKGRTVAGSMVMEGSITRNRGARLLRGKEVLAEGKIDTLKRFKDDVTEVKAGFECGIRLDGFDRYEEGDVIESFELEKNRPTL